MQRSERRMDQSTISGNSAKANYRQKFMHAKIKDVRGKKIKCSSFGCIKSKDGTMLMEKKEILNRWAEYVEDLFKDDRCKKPKIKKNIEGPTILKEEVEAAIKKMKNGKATGPDNIPVEIIKALDTLGIDLRTKLLNAIYDSGTVPEDICKSVFIVVPKTPGATECELHRTELSGSNPLFRRTPGLEYVTLYCPADDASRQTFRVITIPR
ncbi:endonuclease-reverse transcriptase [Plakobranchus ocellatus]|uniref:Endonuclease-reverse transcriptase n=1 Tax=Plakobranchus ocellatus TaxID=259542 RepID=A0AAV4BKT7_9GAST|nr:endonuclease-reverse transcriptase [Plakobranchus ocellatus]